MVKLGIISDSHGAQRWVEAYLALANRARYDAVFHLGDGDGDARWLERRLDMPLIGVAGNCDCLSRRDREVVAAYEGHVVLATHGHRYDVKWGLEALAEHAGLSGADVALYGHTHEARACFTGSVLMINPGALMHGCCAELLIDAGRVVPLLRRVDE